MTAPVNLMDAVQAAVFAALSGRAELTALSAVTQHLKQDMAWPITRLGEVASEPIGGKGEQLEQVSVQVETLYRGTSQAEALAIMHQQRLALDGQELDHPGVAFDTPEWAGAAVDGPAKDGVTYVGVQTFVIVAEPEQV